MHGHGVLALETHHGVFAEERRGVGALDPVLIEVADAVAADRHGAEFGGADEHERDARMLGELGQQRVPLSDLLGREAMVEPGEPHQPEVARADHRDRGFIGRRRTSAGSRSTTPSVVLLASAARATVGPTPLLRVISDRNALTNVDPSAAVSDWTTVARPPIRSRTTSPRLWTVALLEGGPKLWP